MVYVTAGISIVLLIMIYKGQIQKTVKAQSVKGVSLSMNIMKNMVTILTITSLAIAGNGIISYVSQILSLILGSVTVVQWFYYHNKEKGAN